MFTFIKIVCILHSQLSLFFDLDILYYSYFARIYIHFFFVELPKITVDRKRKNDEMGTKMFVVSIESFLAVSYAQWSKKNNDDNSFTPVDVNAEDYKGTSNSLPCPVLVFKQKQKELTQCFQIAVTNSVGTSYKMIQGNIELPENYNIH